MAKKKILLVSGILALALAIFLSLPQNWYIVKALIYQKPNIDDMRLFHNRTVDSGDVSPWRFSPSYGSVVLNRQADSVLTLYKTTAYLVAVDSSLLFEAYFDGYGPDSASNSFSMAKSIVGLLIGCAIDDGYIYSVDQPIAHFLPEFDTPTLSSITIKHLLTMSSGLSWDEAYSSLFSMTTKGFYGNDIAALVLNQHRVSAPGVQFEYRSGDTQLLSLIISRVTGKSVSQYASEKLWKPLGAEHPAYWSLDKEDGNEKAFCCFNSNARDFARIGQLVLNNGIMNGQQVISSDYLQSAIFPDTTLVDPELGGVKNTRYGYQWWYIRYRDMDIHYARGILGQYIFAIPSKRMVVVRLGHFRSNEKQNGHPLDVYRYLDIAFDMVEKAE